MNVVEKSVESNNAKGIPTFLRLDVGSIVMLRMRGHTHSPGGLEYFAPAVVLAQYNDDYGSIDAVVWDSHAGTHSAMGYHVRELGVRGDGPEREMYELQSNIGQVLFAPCAFSDMQVEIDLLQQQVRSLQQALAHKAMPSEATTTKSLEKK